MEHGWMIVSSYLSQIECILKHVIVNQVHWLQAKAQFERWKEEQYSIHNEAAWVPAYFHTKAELWNDWRNFV
jgi:hypothetical protein